MTQQTAPSTEKVPARAPQVIITIGVTLVVTFVLWLFFHKSGDRVTAKMTAYKLTSPSTFEVTFEVNKAYIAEATCRIEALDASFRVVGAVSGYKVGPQTNHHRKTVHTVEIPVVGVPVTGQVESCVITRDH